MTDNIEVFTQSSIRIAGDTGIVYIDTYEMKQEPHDADYILITHDHYDHFSIEDIKKVARKDTVLIIPETMKDKASQVASIVGKICTVKPGCDYDIDDLKFSTVPAYNVMKPFHPKNAGWVGYILDLSGKRIYVSGDTDITKENQQVKCDIALVPIGGTYTMDARKAAELVNKIRPEVAIPTHYGSIVGKMSDAQVLAANVDSGIKVEIKIK